ncbi:2'-5' RNA ligase family protein [Ensifer sp. ENS11]|uniref:2'-5' RNA ligase family protein n=1 Tax=Ensifer sp. ENS11 TaxID=2769291 RepID=UPI00178122C5|nr:2'-5' RNA ligase family protein [Ensifer sp. ENS11]MBD9491411.1 2'-5' RNA ligase family protein [Ensifer sp. ENS11]
MSDYHSIWLMPAAGDLNYFRGIVSSLSAQFGTDLFCPHLTLVEDMPRRSDELARLVDRVVAGRSAFTCAVADITGTTLFYRSLYAAFAKQGDLLALKEHAIEVFRKGDITSFTPHISLAYGVPSGEEKDAAIATLSRALTGRSVTFDSVVVAASAQSIPIADWKITSRHALQSCS